MSSIKPSSKKRTLHPVTPAPATLDSATRLAELITLSGSLGRGFDAPWGTFRASYYFAGLHEDTMDLVGDAAAKFHATHEKDRAVAAERIKEIGTSGSSLTVSKKELDAYNNPILAVQGLTPDEHPIDAKRRMLKEREELMLAQAMSPDPMWSSALTPRNVLLKKMSESEYGYLNFFDSTGERLSKSLRSSLLFPAELSHYALTAKTKQCAQIASEGKDSAKTISFGSNPPELNYINLVPPEHAACLIQSIQYDELGATGRKYTVVLPSSPSRAPVYHDEHQVYRLFDDVYRRGEAGKEDSRVHVTYDDNAVKAMFEEFLSADVATIAGRADGLDEAIATACEWGPVSAHTMVRVAAKAAMTKAFLDRYKGASGLELNASDLELAKEFALTILESSSPLLAMEQAVIDGAKSQGRGDAFSPDKMMAGLRAAQNYLADSEGGFFPHSHVPKIPGLTLGILKRLVANGDLQEHLGDAASAHKPGCTRIYTIPQPKPSLNLEEQTVVLDEAFEQYKTDPTSVDATIMQTIMSLRSKATRKTENSILRMSDLDEEEVAALPLLLRDHTDIFAIRGGPSPNPHAPGWLDLMTEEADWTQVGLDPDGIAIWSRYDKDGKAIQRWAIAEKLELTGWTDEHLTTD